ncbi:hypothetical protein [Tateyamaria pelophila]|uniref:hypothetical protein n=1 Tax=Tateyamaria pelophila TaxID=328415 RepID=UPI002958D194|nr:hypothetical protein [Tateyamaria pelophila]
MPQIIQGSDNLKGGQNARDPVKTPPVDLRVQIASKQDRWEAGVCTLAAAKDVTAGVNCDI